MLWGAIFWQCDTSEWRISTCVYAGQYICSVTPMYGIFCLCLCVAILTETPNEWSILHGFVWSNILAETSMSEAFYMSLWGAIYWQCDTSEWSIFYMFLCWGIYWRCDIGAFMVQYTGSVPSVSKVYTCVNVRQYKFSVTLVSEKSYMCLCEAIYGQCDISE